MNTLRIKALAAEIAGRETVRAPARQEALRRAEWLHQEMTAAVSAFAAAAHEAGAPHLDLIRIGRVEPDDKSIRAYQFRIRRGCYEGIVVCKDRGEVMFVGPFKRGSQEGPCLPVRLEQGEPALQKMAESLEALLISLIDMAYRK